MAKIQILPLDLASQIAAGEVVERPASIVKELIENSLDAEATRIVVSITRGGLSELVVKDDGKGMSRDDAPLCLHRHATSKLTRIEDLEDLSSYGFRGEALPSISSVSRVTITTRTATEDAGAQLVAEGTTEPVIAPTGAPTGTTVEVRDLFFNVPARRKFLKSSNTESGHVTETVVSAALTRPDVAFELLRDGRRVRHFERAKSRADRVAQVFDDEELLRCEGVRGPLAVEAFLSRPERARQGALGLKLIVNGRAVRDRALAATVAHAYGSILERGRYPRGVLFLELPGRLLDVNVHPQKVEVRFAEPRPALDAVHGIVSRSLGPALSSAPRVASTSPTPISRETPNQPELTDAGRGGSPWSQPGPKGRDPRAPSILRDRSPPVSGVRFEPGPGASASPSSALPQRGRPSFAPTSKTEADSQLRFLAALPGIATEQKSEGTWKNLTFLSQVRQTFLICEGDDGLYVLDQHAAAERVIFSKLSQSYQARNISTQTLLFPVLCDMTPKESEVLEERREDIAHLGLDVRIRTSEQASVHGVPKILAKHSPERLLRDLLRELAKSGDRAYSDAVDKVLATMACHAAVRAGDPLTQIEGQALLAQLDRADFAGYCPHGRPIVAFVSWLELERKVGRR